jgi:hypothetical protein
MTNFTSKEVFRTVIRKGVLHKHPTFLLYFQKSQNMLRKTEPMQQLSFRRVTGEQNMKP